MHSDLTAAYAAARRSDLLREAESARAAAAARTARRQTTDRRSSTAAPRRLAVAQLTFIGKYRRTKADIAIVEDASASAADAA